ncbi:MAG TPA: acid phosphatase [Steroidobacteraceae bacterium]|nr:acid phosphatase [Steroidobacteraceae bacterium]
MFIKRTVSVGLALLMLSGHSCDVEELRTYALKQKVDTIVVIYAENRSFDNLYGLFPGANGIPGVNRSSRGKYISQTDRDGSVLQTLPQTWGGVTEAGQTPVITQAQSAGLANAPYPLETGFGITLTSSIITSDLVHKFWENQMQINGGKNDQFAAFSDVGGLALNYNDGRDLALWDIARQYVLADNFFMGAFGGSYLNHQYLICACAPTYPDAETAPVKPSFAQIDVDANGAYLPRLKLAATSPASALDGPPVYVNSGNVAPKDYFGDDQWHTVNTMFPPYQPSLVPPSGSDPTKLYATRNSSVTLPAQTLANIGDRMTAGEVSWKWYTGAWAETLALATTTRAFPARTPGSAPNFQFHHQAFNYYANMDPVTNAEARAQHLQDYNDLLADAAAGTLPNVTFYKPQGNVNQHSGYASVKEGDEHIAQLIATLQRSPQWKKMVIVVTYDENGGLWDHVAPPKAERLGPGTRIPAIIVSPLAKRGHVDHTQYDTGSIQRLINRRFTLEPLPGIVARDQGLKANKQPKMGDLTEALDLLLPN